VIDGDFFDYMFSTIMSDTIYAFMFTLWFMTGFGVVFFATLTTTYLLFPTIFRCVSEALAFETPDNTKVL
jgi:hypothetical protein